MIALDETDCCGSIKRDCRSILVAKVKRRRPEESKSERQPRFDQSTYAHPALSLNQRLEHSYLE